MLADALLTVEYTALDSPVYREQVLRTLDPVRSSLIRPFSLRQDFTDIWYDLCNSEADILFVITYGGRTPAWPE